MSNPHLIAQIHARVTVCYENAKRHGITPERADQCDGEHIEFFNTRSKVVRRKACARCPFRGEA